MSWKFNPPPGWPEQPEGWTPPPGWTPDPSWPPPPEGWQFWVQAPPAGAPPPSQAPPHMGAGPPQPPPPYGHPGPGPGAPKPWFARWWGILGLVGALVVGGLLGFVGTSLAQSSGGDDPQPSPSPTAAPPPTRPTDPTDPPLPTDIPTDEVGVCGDVGVIMVQMLADTLNASEEDDPQAALVQSRRDAAGKLRDVDTTDPTEQDALDTFADELDAAADDLEGGPFTEDRYTDFAERSNTAWDDFNQTTGC